MKYVTYRLCAFLLAFLLLISGAPQLTLAAETVPEPSVTLGTFSGDMLAGGGVQVKTDMGLFCLGQEDGYIYNSRMGSAPVYDKPAARLNYADGVLYFAHLKEGCFDLCAFDVAARTERILLENFSGQLGQLYLVNGEKLNFLCDSAVWELDLETGEYRLVLFAPDLWSFVPTGCGLIYATGTLFDYSLYADGRLLAEHVDDYYVDFQQENGLLVFTREGVDCQMNLGRAFTGEGEILPYEGCPVEPAGETLRNVSNRDTEEEEALIREAEAAEEMDALNADILNQEINLPPLLKPVLDEFPDQEDPTGEEPVEARTEAEDPENPEVPGQGLLTEPDSAPEETEAAADPEAEGGMGAFVSGEEPMDETDAVEEDLFPEVPEQLAMPAWVTSSVPAETDENHQTQQDLFRRSLSEGTQNIVRRAEQMLNIRWTPRQDVAGWGNRYTYQAGVTYTGLPYGQPVNAAYVPWVASLSEFAAEVDRSDSLMYTSKSTFNKTAPYYSVDCSGFASWAWDLPYRCTTSGLTSFSKLVSRTTYSGIQVGDILNDINTHVVLVTDVTYDRYGTITGIEISEATPTASYYGCCRSTWYTGSNGLAAFRTNYLDRGYAIYRAKDRDSVSYTHTCAVALPGDVCSLCGYGMFLQPGVDVSSWQGEVDWNAAAHSLSFAILRIGYGAKTLDRQFYNNVNGCEAHNLPYGVYLYGLATTPEGAREEAEFVLSKLGRHWPELPIFYDVEEARGNLALSNAKLLEVVRAFCDTIEAAGYQAGVYCSTYYWDTKLTSPDYNNWCRWVAQYPKSCTPDEGANLWQYSASGDVPGFTTEVDLDFWFGPVGNTEHRFRSVSQKPTCTREGSLGYICVECGESVTKPLPAAGHQYEDNVCTVCGAERTAVDTFTDVSAKDWYAEAVEFVLKNGLFNGVTETMFAPEAYMNRGMAATVLWRLAGTPATDFRALFTDVAENAYFSQAVTWVTDMGIASGTPFHRFTPEEAVTREQMATFLYRFAKYRHLDRSARADLLAFPDCRSISSYAEKAMSWAVAEGLITGTRTDSGIFLQPDREATRAEVASMLMQFSKLLEKP